MPNGPTKQLSIRLPEDEKDAIERAAYWERVSVNEAVRKTLREWSAAVLERFGERASFLPPKE